MEDPRHVNSLIPSDDPHRDLRMQWWTDARFGMFIHHGPYSVPGRGEWMMQQEQIPADEYAEYAIKWNPENGCMEQWAEIAQKAGMKYAIMTAKHCDGFQLWNSVNSDFNAEKMGPGRDLVREFLETFRRKNIRVGLYYCLMDWRHPDGDRCAIDETARKRFVEFTYNNVEELVTKYGKIDILWFDGPWPLPTPEQWESRKLIDMIRTNQPDIIINNRARVAEDFSTPEGEIAAQAEGRYWEACMTMNSDWGWAEHPAEDWESTRSILKMLRKAAAHKGNLLLNVGPRPDGSIPPDAINRLKVVGAWLEKNGEAVYGDVTRIDGKLEEWVNTGFWTLKDTTGYFWLLRGNPGPQFSIGGIETKVNAIEQLDTGKCVDFRQESRRLRITGLPHDASDCIAGTRVLKITFEKSPVQKTGAGMILLPESVAAWW